MPDATVMVLVLDDAGLEQLAHALIRNAKQCRATGQTLSPGMRELTSKVTESARERLRATTLDSGQRPAHAVAVNDSMALRYAEAANALSVSKRTINRMVNSGTLSPVRETGAPRIPIAQIRALLGQRPQ